MLIFSHERSELLYLSGRDATRYLQGRITQDVRSLKDAEQKLSLLLSPQGKIEGQFFIRRFQDGYLLILDPFLPPDYLYETFLQALFRFKVADDVVCERVTGSVCCSIFYEQEAPPFLAEQLAEISSSICLDVARADLKSIDLVLEREKFQTIGVEAFLNQKLGNTFTCLTPIEFDSLRIRSAYPLYGIDISIKNIAPELPMDSRVSFTKGCYSGQEVVEMASARGRANKRFFKAEVEPSKDLETDGVTWGFQPSGYDLFTSEECSGKSIGIITSISKPEDGKMTCLGFISAKFEGHESFVRSGSTTASVKLL